MGSETVKELNEEGVNNSKLKTRGKDFCGIVSSSPWAESKNR
jgi:hypothetical protein